MKAAKLGNTSLAAFYGIFYLRVKWERYISMAKKKKSTAGKWVKRIAALFMLFLMLFGVFWAARSAFEQNEPASSKQASKKSSTSVDNRVVEIDITNGDVYIMPGTQTVAKNAETVKAIVKQDDGSYIITKSDGTKLKVLANQVRQIIRAND